MLLSTSIVVFDQHASSVTAVVLFPRIVGPCCSSAAGRADDPALCEKAGTARSAATPSALEENPRLFYAIDGSDLELASLSESPPHES
jgi:hypothetical protein